MTEDEALRMAREAMQKAVRRHGSDRQALIAALEAQGKKNPALMEAFAITGYLADQAKAETKQ